MFTPRHVMRGLVAASLLAATSAFAGIEGPPSEYTKFLKMMPMDVMHAIDTAKKGYVTREEFMKFHEAMFERMDKDHDGKLAVKEFMISVP